MVYCGCLCIESCGTQHDSSHHRSYGPRRGQPVHGYCFPTVIAYARLCERTREGWKASTSKRSRATCGTPHPLRAPSAAPTWSSTSRRASRSSARTAGRWRRRTSVGTRQRHCRLPGDGGAPPGALQLHRGPGPPARSTRRWTRSAPLWTRDAASPYAVTKAQGEGEVRRAIGRGPGRGDPQSHGHRRALRFQAFSPGKRA